MNLTTFALSMVLPAGLEPATESYLGSALARYKLASLPLSYGSIELAGLEGVEPSTLESKSSVMPFHHSPIVWRKEWDSNPRRITLGGFQDRCIKPLCHPSSGAGRGTRTLTLKAQASKACVATNYTTPAYLMNLYSYLDGSRISNTL